MNNLIKYFFAICLAFFLVQCMGPYKGEYNIHNNYSSSIQVGDEWQEIDAKWSFNGDAELVITRSDNSSVKGLWFAQDEMLDIVLAEESISYSVKEIASNEILLKSFNNEIILTR